MLDQSLCEPPRRPAMARWFFRHHPAGADAFERDYPGSFGAVDPPFFAGAHEVMNYLYLFIDRWLNSSLGTARNAYSTGNQISNPHRSHLPGFFFRKLFRSGDASFE
jgi:hypothetical protein